MDRTVKVIHLNLLSRVGRATASQYKVSMVPATLLFGQQGELLNRQMGIPNAAQLHDVVDQ